MTLQVQENNFDTMLSEIENTQKQCKALLQSKHYAAMGEAGVFAILQKAKSLQMNPVEALNGGLYYVQGKVGMSTETMASMIRGKGHSIIKDPKSDNNLCILHGRRGDNGDTWTCSFSIDDAKRAGLYKGTWEKYPAVMTYNRACSMLARQLFPDVIKGAGYTFDELKEIADSKSSSFTPTIEIQEAKLEPVEIITFDLASELTEILNECDPEYKKRVLDFIKQPPYNAVNGVYELPVTLHKKFKTGALANRAEYQAKIKPQDTSVSDEEISQV